MADCTFRPAINRHSDRLMADRSIVLRVRETTQETAAHICTWHAAAGASAVGAARWQCGGIQTRCGSTASSKHPGVAALVWKRAQFLQVSQRRSCYEA